MQEAIEIRVEMSDSFQDALNRSVPKHFLQQGLQNKQARQNAFENLLTHKKLPVQGFEDSMIEYFLQELAVLDSNNFDSNVGVGEREGRVYSRLVARRNYNIAHGIGRSGELTEVQPKAAGASVIYKLTTSLASHALQLSGLNHSKNCIIMPLATGMTLAMCMLSLKRSNTGAKYVIWPRIDQKSCFKSILTAGLTPLIVDNIMIDGEVRTNMAVIESLLNQHGSEVLCVLSTTSCFAPRNPDLVDQIAVLCKQHGVGHVINNAYGVQCSTIARQLNRACVKGRVDAIVQSTDKNFLVPVGGAIVISPSAEFIAALSSCYPGRASIAPILDLFITLLSMGQKGFSDLLKERTRLLPVFREGLLKVLASHGLTLLPSSGNTISMAVSINTLHDEAEGAASGSSSCSSSMTPADVTYVGSMLFRRNVSGCRVVARTNKVTKISGFEFINWGSHISNYPHDYFTVACAVGLREAEIVQFLERLHKVLGKVEKERSKSSSASSSSGDAVNAAEEQT